MALNRPSSRSLKLHVKYFENGNRYDNGSNKNQSWAVDWQLAP